MFAVDFSQIIKLVVQYMHFDQDFCFCMVDAFQGQIEL